MKFLISIVFSALALLFTTAMLPDPPAEEVGRRTLVVVGEPEIVLGAPAVSQTTTEAANFALPEDAIEAEPGVYVIADTQAGYIKIASSGRVAVSAGNGEMFPGDSVTADTPHKALAPLALHPVPDGYLSFSSRGIGVNLHRPDGSVSFIGNTYEADGRTEELSFVKFTAELDGDVIALNGGNVANHLVRITQSGMHAMPTPPAMTGQSIAGFDFCGTDLVVSHVAEKGSVIFTRYRDGVATELFSEQRPYSNAIHCIGPDDFYYGARWEIKRYTDGNRSVVADGFVHVASIRAPLSGEGILVTDSDSEIIEIIYDDGQRRTIASTKGQLLSDSVIQMKVVGDYLLAMTSDATLIRISTETGKAEALLSPAHDAIWNTALGGHSFVSMRAFEYDQTEGALYIASNHAIFRVDVASQTMELFAGSENEYGRMNGQRKEARFAVIRDLHLSGRRLYVADAWNDLVRYIDLDTGTTRTALGTGTNETERGNDPCTRSSAYNLNRPMSLTSIGSTLLVANSHSHSLLAINGTKACVIAGTPNPSLDQYGGGYANGQPGTAKMSGPMFISSSASGTVIADMWNNAIRHLGNDRELSTIFQDDNAARMVSAAVIVGDHLYFASSDATIKRVRVTETAR